MAYVLAAGYLGYAYLSDRLEPYMASSFVAHPWSHENRPYKAEDLAPIARVSNTVIGISVPTVMPVKSLAELVALAKSKPGELNWAGVTGALDFSFAGWLKQTIDKRNAQPPE